MKKVIIISVFLLSALVEIVAQCEEPSIEKTGVTIAARNFEIARRTLQSETILEVESATENSSWAIKGAESAVLTIFVDDQYNQDVMLFSGAEKFVYKVTLGKFAPGKHQVKIVLNEKRSAKNARKVKIFALEVKQTESESAVDAFAAAHSPIIYARPDTIDKFSDVPLLTYYEVFPIGESDFKIRYTTIFTNEDGGTQTAALMARWGRATDIEWVYETEIKNGVIVWEVYQGANHETKTFAGRKILGNHPLIFDVTVNNNFADSGCSDLRFVPMPIRADLSSKSRETVMDENAWTYRIMAEEAAREGRVNAAKLDANTIADPREYLYAEIYSETKNAAINIEAQISAAEIYTSDKGSEQLRVNRPGYVRIALYMPPNRSDKFPKTINVGCYALSGKMPSESGCQNVRLIKLVRLDRNYLPVIKEINAPAQNVKTGEKASFSSF